MELAARPYVTAGVVLAAAGMIAATPVVAPALSQVHTQNIQLTAGEAGSFLEDILGQQLASNSSLIEGLFSSNADIVAGQTTFIADVFNSLKEAVANGDLEGIRPYGVNVTLQQFFDANNALGGAAQASMLGLLGARGTLDDEGVFTSFDPAQLNAGLLVDPNHTNSIPFAGLESAIGHYIGALAFAAAIDSSVPGSSIEDGPAGEAFEELVASVTNFNDELVSAQQAFSTNLVDAELALEQALYGTDNAYNGVVNNAFNIFNLMFDAQQQSLNGLLGITAYDPQELTGLLLIGNDSGALDDGSIGGLMGAFDQSMALFANLGGLLGGADTGIPSGFEFDPDAVGTALNDLFATLGSGPFGDVFSADGAFSDLMSDLGTMFTAAFAG